MTKKDYNNEFVQQLKNATGIRRVLNLGSGTRHNCVFPGHQNDISGDLFVSEDDSFYKCHKCGKKGDVIQAIQDMELCNFSSAIERLIDITGIKPLAREKLERRIQTLEAAFAHYQSQFQGNRRAQDYVASRGWDPEIFGKVCGSTGVVPLSQALPDMIPDLIEFGLTTYSHRGYVDRFINRLVFPIYNKAGSLIQMHARCIGPKGNNTKVIPLSAGDVRQWRFVNFLYNEKVLARRIKHVFICEGQCDAYTLQERRIAAVGLLGNTGLYKHAEKFKNIDRVSIILDQDGPSQEMLGVEVQKFIAALRRMNSKTKVGLIFLPHTKEDCKDVNDWFLHEKGSVSKLKNIVKNSSIDAVDYLIELWKGDVTKHRLLIPILHEDEYQLLADAIGQDVQSVYYGARLLTE